jgi:hypothetical protein
MRTSPGTLSNADRVADESGAKGDGSDAATQDGFARLGQAMLQGKLPMMFQTAGLGVVQAAESEHQQSHAGNSEQRTDKSLHGIPIRVETGT